MVFKINDSVFVPKMNEIKKIIDSEIVSDVELYYMSDKTAYPVDELIPLDVCTNYFLSDKFDLMSLFEFELD
jgi:hypothetical protein